MNAKSISRRSILGAATVLGVAVRGQPVGTDSSSAAPSMQAGQPHQREGRDRKVVLITGTSSGFGRLIALTLARLGYEVHATMRHLQHKNAAAARELKQLAHREGLALEAVDIDVRSERSVESGVERVLRRAGRIDVLVNNAGIFYPALLETQTIEQVQQVFETNVFGALRMNRAVLPSMRDQGGGLVVQMTSGVGRIAFPFQGAYNGSKWAMEAMAQVSRYELSQTGVDVVIVEPGAYDTDLVDPNGVALYRRYLRRLTPGNARRRTEYGDLARRVENELQEPPESKPQEVADAVARLIRTPPGRRPLRTLVGGDTELIGDINAVHQRIQDQILQFAGYGDLISVQPKTGGAR